MNLYKIISGVFLVHMGKAMLAGCLLGSCIWFAMTGKVDVDVLVGFGTQSIFVICMGIWFLISSGDPKGWN